MQERQCLTGLDESHPLPFALSRGSNQNSNTDSSAALSSLQAELDALQKQERQIDEYTRKMQDMLTEVTTNPETAPYVTSYPALSLLLLILRFLLFLLGILS